MKKRQVKKIVNLYLYDSEGQVLLPPSMYRAEEKKMEKYFSKAFCISHPKEAEEIRVALEKAYEEAEKEQGTEN